MDAFDTKLMEYADRFGENFPTMEYRYATMAQIIEMINKCLEAGKPMESMAKDDKTI